MNGSSLKISRIFRSKSMGTIYRARERCGAPVEIRMAAMAEFRKSGAKEPFLWNCAAAARRNRKAGYSYSFLIKIFDFYQEGAAVSVALLRQSAAKAVS